MAKPKANVRSTGGPAGGPPIVPAKEPTTGPKGGSGVSGSGSSCRCCPSCCTCGCHR